MTVPVGTGRNTSSSRLAPMEVAHRLEQLYSPCVLCEVRCGADRLSGVVGACGLADDIYVYNRLVHMGEEAPLVPSYAIFLSGCNMACTFCSEWRHLEPPFAGELADEKRLAALVAGVVATGEPRQRPSNVNFVGGEPAIALPFIARFAAELERVMEDPLPILLNTNGLLTPRALALATHVARIFVVDLKFGNDQCATRVGGVQRYWEPLTRNLRALYRGELAAAGGSDRVREALMPVQLWVRHLLMPGHLECCTRPTLRWLSDNVPEAHVNLMPAFVPYFGDPATRWPELGADERERGAELLSSMGFVNAYFDGKVLS